MSFTHIMNYELPVLILFHSHLDTELKIKLKKIFCNILKFNHTLEASDYFKQYSKYIFIFIYCKAID